MKVALVYASKSGNTKELVELLYNFINIHPINVNIYCVNEFPITQIKQFDAIIIGTYTWGNGDIPHEMVPLYQAFENQEVKRIVTGVVGTGDSFYPKFCGAVDVFKDMLFVCTDLAVTMKVELRPQVGDLNKCMRFVDLLLERLKQDKTLSELQHN
ncbi:flavodoxin domain-containing protein [Neobacillus pocheonensis]|uniref:flavodoxin domain-containing protein n=1 Tax=Neobacillus pocheonensis TaxID=363869 RepID=UPI003D2A50E4